MKVSDYLELTTQLPIATREDLTDAAPFVVLSPHPDDETLGAGGLLKQASGAGQHVDVVVLTDGSGSHPLSLQYPEPRLVNLRREEVLEAAEILGLPASRIHHFNIQDTRAPTDGPAFEAAVNSLVTIIESCGAKSLFVTWAHDPHCDHESAAAIAETAVKNVQGIRLWAYPIWGWHLDPDADIPGFPRGYRLDIAAELESKHRAIAAHRSQMSNLIDDDPTGFRFTTETLAPFLGSYEFFYEITP